jgi:hypothetical protein
LSAMSVNGRVVLVTPVALLARIPANGSNIRFGKLCVAAK